MTPEAPRRLVDGLIVQEWMDLAACRGSDTDLFYPGTGGAGPVMSAQARAICAGCEVREECLEYALVNQEQHGIWGGLDRDERRAVRRGRVA